MSGPNPPHAAQTSINHAVARVAARQHGNVTRKQLLDAGTRPRSIDRGVEQGRLYRVHRGVYAVGRPPTTPVERAAAAVLSCGRDAVLSHLSAARLWGIVKRWPDALHVSSPSDRRPTGVATHHTPSLTHRDRRRQLGIAVTSPARTVLDCAPLIDLDRLTRFVNDARLSTDLTLPALRDTISRFPTHPGARLLKPLLSTTGGPTRSEMEDGFRSFCERFGLPEPVMNTHVAGHEVDALFEAEKLIVELDSWEFHSDRGTFESDRDRDADTLQAGYPTVRVTWERMLARPHPEAARLLRILKDRRSAARLGGGPVGRLGLDAA